MSASRKKSCQECRSAKARCDLQFPGCTRCHERQKSCRYDKSRVSIRLGSHRVKTTQPTSKRGVSSHLVKATDNLIQSNLQSQSDFRTTNHITLDQLDCLTPLISGFQNEIAPTAADFTPTCRSDLLVTDWSISSVLPLDIESTATTRTLDISPGLCNGTSNDVFQPKEFPLGSSPAQNLTTRFLNDTMLDSHLEPSPEMSLIISMIGGKVNHFPSMIIEGPYLPPFIHPRCAARDNSGASDIHQVRNQLLEPLAICASIMHMFIKGTKSSMDFIKRTMQAEQLRLLNEHPQFDNPTSLAALQALVIYLILQALETETWKQPGIMCVGIQAIFEISHLLLSLGEDGFTSKPTQPGQKPSWEDWAFFESHRRTINVLFLLQRSLQYLTPLYAEMSISCEGYDRVPLPCARNLWFADTSKRWEREYEDRITEIEDSRVLSLGFISRPLHCGQEASEFQILQKWCSQLDDFGSLVWAAARVRKG